MDDDTTQDLAAQLYAQIGNIHKNLKHPDRIRLLRILYLKGPRTRKQLMSELGANSRMMSWHLKLLSEPPTKFIKVEPEKPRRGRRRYRLTKLGGVYNKMHFPLEMALAEYAAIV